MKYLFLLLLLPISLFAQDKPAYKIYRANGKKIKYKKMVKTLEKADIILFGEIHNNPITHWLQLESTTDLAASRQLILGAEMFEADNQTPLNDYLKGNIDVAAFAEQARLWNNYDTDYAPLVNFAKENNLSFVATNVPRRYARTVFREGLEALETLPNNEKAWIAPLPIAYDGSLPGYKAMLDMMGDNPAHGGDNFPKAQAIKDATMGHFILDSYEDGKLFIHYNGSYHSDNYEGILWYLRRQRPDLNYVTISTVLQADIDTLAAEHKNKADFILCIPETMTTTY
ncbi:MAG: ChaN family lipoprotein [Bacteroidota bacterium]